VPVYVVDHAGRARSGFDPSPTNQARLAEDAGTVPSFQVFTNEAARTRITIAALAVLLDRIGPAVILVHSQSGAYGLGAALERPALVKAIVSVEPRSCAVPDPDVQTVFAHVPLLTMFGDFFGTDVGDWPGRMAECVATVNKIKAAKGTADNIHLPSLGIAGNSHMLMMDTNNQQVADLILAWLDRHARAR
jgi:pimeloyl-ACP methyl ester carboxylesterase